MHNKFYSLFLLLLSFDIQAHTQSIAQGSLSSAGRSLSNGGIQLNFTVGELVIENFTDSVVGINTGLFGKGAIVQKEAPLLAGTASLSIAAFCTSGSAVLSATGYTNAKQHQWQYSSDNFITDIHDLSGATTPDSSNTGAVTATTHYRLKTCCNAAGTPVYSNTITLTSNQPPPAPVVSLSGAATFCAGGKATLSSSTASGNQWFKDGVAIAGVTGQTYDATQSGIYSVKSSNANCTSDTSTAIVITAVPLPSKPSITQSQNKLISSATEGNQWYLEGAKIEGATDTVYIPSASGNYSVQVSANGCSSQQSDALTYKTNINNNDSLLQQQVQVFPNPFSNKITIINRSDETLQVQLFDASGRLSLSKQIGVGSHEIQTNILAKGWYSIKIVGEESNRSTGKFIIKTD